MEKCNKKTTIWDKGSQLILITKNQHNILARHSMKSGVQKYALISGSRIQEKIRIVLMDFLVIDLFPSHSYNF